MGPLSIIYIYIFFYFGAFRLAFVQVLLGGGRQKFLPNISNPGYGGEYGHREDGLDLIQVRG